MSGLRQRNKRKKYRATQQTRLKIVSLDGQVRSKLQFEIISDANRNKKMNL